MAIKYGSAKGGKIFPHAHWCASAYEAATQADLLLILTEWTLFQNLDLKRIESLMKTPVVLDCRSLYDAKDFEETSILYQGFGQLQTQSVKSVA